ncbi:hypothetical protein G6F70_008012 [Rhizopus microsporus]|uniref:Homeobox domain-containing protein n=2 Tax=Rhizopus TaxID=4842 RepID=A0A367J6I8_RHIAZ|nr:hypothetical protein G6F71_008003 [Rhizopus microsporus]RCH85449.1 hypothetical protein CU097_008516 [Rhizopus azygosporus]KAG1195727.1 hypothetical protein G6F70_008012 [Rhizopus microsporus]KAG1207570.1 hypothetical protein G6F69_007934 [Rhizopus microsporus]KAG1260368.1 hypothetical protein G6F68_007480 [Rhizopus microsporus]
MKSACTLPSLSDIVNTNDYFYTRQSTKPSILHVSSLLSPIRTDSVLYESDEPVKAKRKRASPSQLYILNRVFQQTCFPSTELRIELGKRLGMSPRTVQIWFQNKRQSTRTRERVTPQQQRRSMFVSPPVSPLPSPSLIKSLSLPPLHPPPAFALSPSSSAHSSPTSIDAMLFRDF